MRITVALIIVTLFTVILLSGCAAIAVSPVTGMLYTNVKAPVTATGNYSPSKVGTASCTSLLGLIATGDASIKTAMKNGGITKVHHVDYRSRSFLGLFAEYIVIVYGE